MPVIDRIDCEILAVLQKNARSSNKELAAAVGLAQSTCLERVRRLVERGVLRGFHAELDPEPVGIGLQAIVAVRLGQHSRKELEAFRKHVLSVPEVIRVYHMAGQDDFLLHVVARDAVHLRETVLSAFSTRPEVARIETSLVFEHVDRHELPVLVELDEE